MTTKPDHSAQCSDGALLRGLAQAIAQEVVEVMDTRLVEQGHFSPVEPLQQAALEKLSTQLDLWKPYTAKDVGAFLGLSASRVYGIDEALLQPTWVGPTGSSKRYLGINILMYVLGQQPVDVDAVGRQVREAFLRQAERPVRVTSIRSTSKQRVL